MTIARDGVNDWGSARLEIGKDGRPIEWWYLIDKQIDRERKMMSNIEELAKEASLRIVVRMNKAHDVALQTMICADILAVLTTAQKDPPADLAKSYVDARIEQVRAEIGHLRNELAEYGIKLYPSVSAPLNSTLNLSMYGVNSASTD